METHPELFSVLTKKYTAKQAKSYYRRLSKQPPEQLADLFGSIAKARGYDRDLVRVTVDAAAYWPPATIQRVLEIWSDRHWYLQLEILKCILLKKYVMNRDIVPIVNALPKKGGASTNMMPFYNAALSTCRDVKEYQHVRLIFDLIKECPQLTPDTATYNILLKMRLSSTEKGDYVSGLRMYQDMVDEGAQPNHATFNTFIKHAIQHKQWSTLEQWLDMMQQREISPTPVTLRILFRALCVNPNQPDLTRAFDRVSAVVPLSSKQEEFLNAGTSALLGQHKTSAAADLLQTTLGLSNAKVSTYAYNLLLRCLCQQGRIESAQHVLTSMITTDSIPEPDIVSFTTVIHGLIRHADRIDLNQINALYDKLEQQDLRSNNVLQSVILYGLVRSKDNNNLQKTRALFDSIISNKNRAQIPVQHGDCPLAEINTYNMMIDFYFLHYHKSQKTHQIPKQVFQLLNEAVEVKKLTPTLVTMNIMVRGLAVLNKDLVAAEKVVALLKSKGVAMDERTVWYLAKSAYRQGQISKARQLIDDFKLPITQSGLKELKSTLNKWDQKPSTTTTEVVS